MVRRDAETINPALPTGEVEVAVAGAELLADSETPPFQIEGYADDVGEDTRLRYRYLDLRRAPMREALLLRHRVTAAMREFLGAEGFVDIETPVLTRSTPEGARDFLVPSRQQQGSFYALPQSPQLFKQLLMVSGFERYFQIARCFRDEATRADRQAEFTQLDVEMSFVEVDDVIAINERMLSQVFAAVGGPQIDIADAADALRRVDGALRHRPAGPALRPRAGRPRLGARRDRVQSLPLGARVAAARSAGSTRASARCRAKSSTASSPAPRSWARKAWSGRSARATAGARRRRSSSARPSWRS